MWSGAGGGEGGGPVWKGARKLFRGPLTAARDMEFAARTSRRVDALQATNEKAEGSSQSERIQEGSAARRRAAQLTWLG